MSKKTTYIERVPCRNCGGTIGYPGDGSCVKCRAAYRSSNKDKIKRRMRRWRRDNAEYIASYNKKYKADNAGWIRPQKVLYDKQYYIDNKAHIIQRALIYKERVRQATLDNLSDEHLQQIIDIYEDAAELSNMPLVVDTFHVDHIQPINGLDRCGLHVPWNLQILTASENRKKSNKIV